MFKSCGIILLLFSLAGCTTTTQREAAEAKDRVRLLELEANIQRIESEMCENRRRHTLGCRGKCTISRSLMTPTSTVTTSNKGSKGRKTAPLSIYSPPGK